MKLITVRETTKSVFYSIPIRRILTEFEETHALLFATDRQDLMRLIVDFTDLYYVIGSNPEVRIILGKPLFGIVRMAAHRLRQCLQHDIKQITLEQLTRHTLHLHAIIAEPIHERPRLV